MELHGFAQRSPAGDPELERQVCSVYHFIPGKTTKGHARSRNGRAFPFFKARNSRTL